MTEQSDPIRTEVYREGMARMGAAITVLATDGPAGKHGMTASAVCSVTDTPPTLLICVNRASRTHDIIRDNGVVAVNVLAGRHQALSTAFAGREEDDRFRSGSWRTLVTGAPVLTDASVAFDCKITDHSPVGSHTVFFCEVQAMELAEGQAETLIWFGRDFHPLKAL
ncbi:flavin reductase [Pseudooceanicola nanhaiensis]|uniref:flavin reductase n=1 Tax=Pseudooceanicola nanhaiensis TaxID=375761 RepID=UPI001CD27E08|nr:flavin reductase [Pseudooceanicola nanhaiensis]MCA0919212.1 flavin reductase [Pseudooceanicola nanhaiensis]